MERYIGVQHNKKSVAFFFTYGVSLGVWEAKGMLERELALYKRLAQKGYRFSFFTYDQGDGRFSDMLAPYHITVFPKKYALPSAVYSFVLPFVYRQALLRCDVFKTNQMLGSWVAVLAKLITQRPLIVRTGYSLSLFARRRGFMRYLVARCIEWFACRNADRVVVATQSDRASLARWAKKIVVIPNYVDTEVFDRIVHVPKKDVTRLLFVGRLEPQKNVAALISAVHDMTGVSLTIVGDGSLRNQLEAAAEGARTPIHFLGHLSQERVRDLFSETDIFVLPSLYEGLPKVLLEAMAAALPIVTTDVPGIRTVVTHNHTATVVEPTADGLRQGIETIQKNVSHALRMGKAAQELAHKQYSLSSVAQKESTLYEEIT